LALMAYFYRLLDSRGMRFAFVRAGQFFPLVVVSCSSAKTQLPQMVSNLEFSRRAVGGGRWAIALAVQLLSASKGLDKRHTHYPNAAILHVRF
jgi:hypothetical protein